MHQIRNHYDHNLEFTIDLYHNYTESRKLLAFSILKVASCLSTSRKKTQLLLRQYFQKFFIVGEVYADLK